MITTQDELIKTLKKQSPDISKEQINATIRHIRSIMSEWKLRVQSDIYDYLINAEDIYQEEDL